MCTEKFLNRLGFFKRHPGMRSTSPSFQCSQFYLGKCQLKIYIADVEPWTILFLVYSYYLQKIEERGPPKFSKKPI
jgi:hypothetical protein